MDWLGLGTAAVCGGLGGVVNAILAGGETYTLSLPGRRKAGEIQLGFMGPIIIGIIAALVAWATALHENTPTAQIAGCLLAGVGGASYLTNRLQARNYRSAMQKSTTAANDAVTAVGEIAQLGSPSELGKQDNDDRGA